MLWVSGQIGAAGGLSRNLKVARNRVVQNAPQPSPFLWFQYAETRFRILQSPGRYFSPHLRQYAMVRWKNGVLNIPVLMRDIGSGGYPWWLRTPGLICMEIQSWGFLFDLWRLLSVAAFLRRDFCQRE